MTSLTTNSLFIPVVVLAVIVLVLIAVIVWLNLKMRRFLIDVDSQNIADSLQFVEGKLRLLHDFKDQTEVQLSSVEKRLKKSVQSVHTVRFNPFQGTGAGGNQSFATTFLTEEGNGVIISSLYSRDHVRVFSKPIKNRLTEHELSDEEKEALEKAVGGLE